MTQDQIDKMLAAGKHLVSYGAGAATVLGFISISSSQDVVTDFDHIFNGIKEITVGVGPLLAIVMGWWAQNKASLTSKVASVKAADPGALVQAVQTVSPVTLRDAVAAQPEVKQVVVTSGEVARASPSAKVTT